MIEILKCIAEGSEDNPELVITIRVPVKEYSYDYTAPYRDEELRLGIDLMKSLTEFTERM